VAPPTGGAFAGDVRRVLKRVDATAAAAAFGAWLSGQVATDLDGLALALDGKTMRGARTGQDKAPHLLAAMVCGARAVIAQRDVDQKTNEITQAKPLLAEVDLRGALLTADAVHVQRETARYLVEDKHADYLFTSVKDNQPSLFAALDALDWPAAPIVHTASGRGHGRHETRTLQVLPAPAGCFPYAAQAFLTERTVHDPHTGQLRSPRSRSGHHQPQTRTRRHPDPHRHRRPQPLGHRSPSPRARRHHARRRPPAAGRVSATGHGHPPQHRHRHPPPGRVHLHRPRQAMGRTRRHPHRRSPRSHNVRMTRALGRCGRSRWPRWPAVGFW